MKHRKTIFIPFLFLKIFCFGQMTDNTGLFKLYNEFPIDSSLSFITNFCEQNNYSTSPNIYDNTKTDFSKQSFSSNFFSYKPTDISIDFFYAYKYGLGEKIPDDILCTTLTIFYQDTVSYNAKNEYELLIKFFKKLYTHSNKEYIVSEHGREGELVKFYIGKKLKLPMLTIELNYSNDNSHWKSKSIYISYFRPYPKE